MDSLVTVLFHWRILFSELCILNNDQTGVMVCTDRLKKRRRKIIEMMKLSDGSIVEWRCWLNTLKIII